MLCLFHQLTTPCFPLGRLGAVSRVWFPPLCPLQFPKLAPGTCLVQIPYALYLGCSWRRKWMETLAPPLGLGAESST